MTATGKFIRLAVVSLCLLALAACKAVDAPLGNTDELSGSPESTLVAAADPLGQSVITGLSNNDYTLFTSNFTADVKKGWDEASFQSFLQDLHTKMGNYQSNQIESVLQNDQYSTIVYTLTFDSGQTVNMRLILSLNEPYQITGLWFDSPDLG